jgi:hypothetical protein
MLPRLPFVSPNVDIDSEKTLEFTLWTVGGRIDESTHLGEGIAQGLTSLGNIAIILSGTNGSRLHIELTFSSFLLESRRTEILDIGYA